MQMASTKKSGAADAQDVPRTMREIVQKKLLDEVVGVSGALRYANVDG